MLDILLQSYFRNKNSKKYILIYLIINILIIFSVIYMNYINHNFDLMIDSEERKTLYLDVDKEQYKSFKHKYVQENNNIFYYAKGFIELEDGFVFLNPSYSNSIENSANQYVIFSSDPNIIKKTILNIEDLEINIIPLDSEDNISFSNSYLTQKLLESDVINEVVIKIIFSTSKEANLFKEELKLADYNVYQMNINDLEYSSYYKLKNDIKSIIVLEFILVFVILIIIAIQLIFERTKEIKILINIGLPLSQIIFDYLIMIYLMITIITFLMFILIILLQTVLPLNFKLLLAKDFILIYVINILFSSFGIVSAICLLNFYDRRKK